MKITRALISVSNKKGIAAFARALERQGVDIISTGGTADLLKKEKIPVREISSFTAFPEVLEGRVKTLHPRVHACRRHPPTTAALPNMKPKKRSAAASRSIWSW